jgi:hypothetical protein
MTAGTSTPLGHSMAQALQFHAKIALFSGYFHDISKLLNRRVLFIAKAVAPAGKPRMQANR